MKLANHFSKIDWKKIQKISLFYTKVILIIFARLVYLFLYESAILIKKVSIFLFTQTKFLIQEIHRRKIFPKMKKALHLGGVITWLLSKKIVTEFLIQAKRFFVYITPYIKKYSKTVSLYFKRFIKRTEVIFTYVLIRLEKTEQYKKIKENTEKYVAKPLLASATSKKPYAMALMVILFVTTSFVILRDQRATEAATAVWTQTTWAGGQGSSSVNQYDSASGVDLGTEITLTEASTWYNDNWAYRKPVTIDADQVSGSSNLTNFPVLVSLTDVNLKSTSNGGKVAQTNGGDIVFTNSAGTKLDHEIESYTPTTGALVAWVEVPTLDYNDDTTLYMYYGNDAGGLSESNAAGVWATDDYAGVWHLGDGDSTASNYYQDSTSNGNDGTLVDADGDTIATTGKIGGAVDFNGDADYIRVPDSDTLSFSDGSSDSPFYMSAWVNMDSHNNFIYAVKLDGSNQEYQFRDVSAQFFSLLRDQSTGGYLYTGNNTAMTNDTWTHVVLSYSGSGITSGIKLYKNGILWNDVSAPSGSYTAMENTNTPLDIGAIESSSLYSNGEIDNLVIGKNNRSADWIATEYANQNNPQTFTIVGSEETHYQTGYDADWSYRSPIVIDADQVSGTEFLGGFPVLINSTNADWKTVANGGYVAQSDGGDILFTDSGGGRIPHEIESYTPTTGALLAWVRVPALHPTSDTTIYMYYGNDAGGLSESNKTGVWQVNDYAAVYHFGETVTDEASVSNVHQDSTSNNNHGNQIKNDDILAKIGIGQDFDGSADYFRSTTTAGEFNATAGSISYWLNVDAYKPAGQPGAFVALGTWPGGSDFITQGNNVNSGSASHVAGGVTDTINIGAPTVAEDVWAYHTMTWDKNADQFKYYINGSQVGSTATTLGNWVSPITYLDFASSNGNWPYDVSGDELRLLRVARSIDWLKTEYNNQNNPSTFYTIETPQQSSISNNILISAAFDTGTSSALVGEIGWTETLPVNTDITFQIRTSADNSTWTDWLGPTSASDYYTDSTGGETVHSTHTDGSSDRYIQYKAFLVTTDGTDTPTLSDVSITYVANGAPNFNNDYPSSSAGGVSTSITTDGTSTVTINYAVRDPDSSAGTATPGYITPSFEYSLNGGSTWASASSTYLGVSDLSNKAVEEVDYSIYSATWNAEGQLGNSIYVTNAKIRVTVNDNEGGNNTATATSSAFTIDTTSPALGSPSMTVDASVSPANITISCTDDTAIQQKTGLASNLSDGTYASYTGTTTQSGVGTPSDIIYGQCRDAHGNETAITSVTTPTQPTNMYYQDISNVSESEYQLFISWSTVPAPSAGFASYKLYRSTDGSSYSLYQTISSRTTNYIIDDALSTGTTYYYKLFVLDNNGNKSAYSAVVSDDPDGTGGTDNTSPSISSVSSTDTPMEASITWTTDELSNSTVYYSATASDPGTNPASYAASQGVGSYVTSHVVALSNLTPGTQYYYLVQSTDNRGNIGIDSSAGTFTTGAGVSISSVSASTIYNEEAIITWNTNSAADSTVYYSTNSDMSSALSINSATDVTSHSVTLPSLSGGTTYYFYVESEASGNTTQDKNVVNGVTEYYDFTTTSDATAPVVSSVANALIGETGVTISWTTDEGSTSQVSWGLTSSLGTDTTETAVYTTQHAVTLTGLTNTTQYYYRVRSEDRAGNVTVDNNSGSMYTVTTNVPGGTGGSPIINILGDTTAPDTDGLSVSPTKNSVTIMFNTDEPAGVFFGWGPASSSDHSINKTNIYQTSHAFTLSGLNPATTYYYKIIVKDTSENERQKTGSFSTLSSGAVVDDTDPDTETPPAEENTIDLGEIDIPDEVGEEFDIIDLTKNASEGTVRDLLQSIFENKNLFNIPSDFLLNSASRLASNFNHSVVSNEDLGKSEKDFLFENLRIAGVTGQTATVVWRTSIPTRTLIYLTDLKSGQTRELRDPSFLLSHEYTISKLEPSGSYSVQVIAEDEFGEKLGSQALSFSTFIDKTPPLISDLKTTTSILSGKENKVQAIISWKTNKPTTSRVLYEAGVGKGDEFKTSSVLNQSFTYEHVMVVSGLQPGQVYRIRAESVDGQGEKAYSQDRTLITPRSKESIVDVIIENFEQTFGFLR